MPAVPTRTMLIVTIIAALGAAGIGAWLWQGGGATAADEAALRDTDGIEVTALDARPTDRGMLVRCQVANRTDRPARSIVLQVELVDADGDIVAANPLANALNVRPGEQRELAVVVPGGSARTARLRPQARPSLVLWDR